MSESTLTTKDLALANILPSAQAFLDNAGHDLFAEKIGRIETGHLLNLRFDLKDHFSIEDDAPHHSLIRLLIETIEHEIGGRWVTPGHEVGEEK